MIRARIVEAVAVKVLVSSAWPKALPVNTCAKFSRLGLNRIVGVAEKASLPVFSAVDTIQAIGPMKRQVAARAANPWTTRPMRFCQGLRRRGASKVAAVMRNPSS